MRCMRCKYHEVKSFETECLRGPVRIRELLSQQACLLYRQQNFLIPHQSLEFPKAHFDCQIHSPLSDTTSDFLCENIIH
jgi:hypothetical protein